MDIKIESSWKAQLQEEFDKPYFQELTQFVQQEYVAGTCYPPGAAHLQCLRHDAFRPGARCHPRTRPLSRPRAGSQT